MLKIKHLLASILVVISFIGCDSPYNDPKKDGYNIKDDSKPWFDGKTYLFYSDMYDEKHIKQQEEGTYQNFPTGSVPVKRVLNETVKAYEKFIPMHERAFASKNPIKADEKSVDEGKHLYNTYCAVCHGKDGQSPTVVTQKGMPAPPIKMLLPVLSESHLYNKIRYGSAYASEKFNFIPGTMPAYGFQTSVEDRWNMVNYMKSKNFGKN